MKKSREMKEYERPTATAVNVTTIEMISASGLGYTDESADEDYEVLAGKHRGEWGDMWKQ